MHLFLTDRLSCPRCGPEFGLILFADEVRAQRVLEGELGCSNCRERYPIRSGFGDFRFPPSSTFPPEAETGAGVEGPRDPEEVVRIGALLGLVEGPGTVLLSGREAAWARNLAGLVGDMEVVGMDPGLAGEEESDGVSRIVAGSRIPFFDGTFLGVLLGRGVAKDLLGEFARVVVPGGHLVILDPGPGDEEAMEGLGFRTILNEERAVVARCQAPDSPKLVTLRGL